MSWGRMTSVATFWRPWSWVGGTDSLWSRLDSRVGGVVQGLKLDPELWGLPFTAHSLAPPLKP